RISRISQKDPDIHESSFLRKAYAKGRRKFMTIRQLILSVGILFFFSTECQLSAQISAGTIVGTAYDESGAIVAGAEITLTNMQTQLRRTVVTDASGNYAAPQLPAGVYKISGSAQSFKRQEVENITLLVNQTKRVDLRFQVGEVTEK